MNPEKILKGTFKLCSFRDGQEEIINSILNGRDILAIMPSGSGKSICFQIPALLFSGITIVVSPLISLMQDQIKELENKGVNATYINSFLDEDKIKIRYKLIEQGFYKIIYVAPERLKDKNFIEFSNRVEISMVVVDEAHCISQWGLDFRPHYLRIPEYIDNLSTRPVISAFTTKASKEVKSDILKMLNLNNPEIFINGFDRKNLYFMVEKVYSRFNYTLQYIKDHINDCGIIYCSTKRIVESLHDLLKKHGISVTKYHSDISATDRQKNQEDFITNKVKIIVTTITFGMDINKPNVRYIIHYIIPSSIEEYYREAGRANRDGEHSQCIILYNYLDIITNHYLLNKEVCDDSKNENKKEVMNRNMKNFDFMKEYCLTNECLRNFILEYFGEKTTSSFKKSGSCDKAFKEVDMTKEAKCVIKCINEIKINNKHLLVKYLKGEFHIDKELNKDMYGNLKNNSEEEIYELINQLIKKKYLYYSNDIAHSININDSKSHITDKDHIMIRKYDNSKKLKSGEDQKIKFFQSTVYDLFELFRLMRIDIAKEISKPAFTVFTDKEMLVLCSYLLNHKDLELDN
eukprot:jgi/Orpsp1_1/1175566/evm.model.c7180000054373.1